MREKKKNKLLPALVPFVLILLIVLSFFIFTKSGRSSGEDAMKEAVIRCCVQCYAIEGAYPQNIEYLKENYGLSINTEDYYVVYDVFASNVPPEVRVVSKNAG